MSEQIPISKINLNNGQLKGVPKNPRFIRDGKFDLLKKSIEEDPEMIELRELIVVPLEDKYVCIAGNMRLRALRELGYKEAPCKVIDYDDKKLRAIATKDNMPYGDWDWDLIANEWDTAELEEWGFEFPEDEQDEEIHLEAGDDDYQEPENIQVDVQIGDLIEIGEHRLLCGDSTDSDQVARLMNGEKADLAHNDPPYGMKKENEGVLNDNLNFKDLLKFNKNWISLQFSHIKQNGSWYCWGIDEPLMDIYSNILKPYIAQQKATFRNLITWFKNPSGLGDGQNNPSARSYGVITEKCLFVMCGVQGFNNNEDNYYEGWESIRKYLHHEMDKCGGRIKWKEALGNQMGSHYFTKSQWALPTEENYKKLQQYAKGNAFHKEYDELKKEYDELKKEYYLTRAYFDNTHDNMTEVWQFDRVKDRSEMGNHATPKPIPLCERVIKSSCPDDGLVIDFFLGSGSTMVAAHQLKRKCYGMELEPKYCQVIIDRMKKLDPSIEVKINGERYEPKEETE